MWVCSLNSVFQNTLNGLEARGHKILDKNETRWYKLLPPLFQVDICYTLYIEQVFYFIYRNQTSNEISKRSITNTFNFDLDS